MSRPRVERPADFLVDNGILFEINRQVLHPLGLELDLEIRDDGAVCQLVLRDNRKSLEPIYFTSEEFEEGREKYESYMKTHGRRNLKKRRQIGMVIQTGPNLPHHIHGKWDEDPDEGESGE